MERKTSRYNMSVATTESMNCDDNYTSFLETWREAGTYTHQEWETHIQFIADVLTGDIEGVEIDDDKLTIDEYYAVYNALHGR